MARLKSERTGHPANADARRGGPRRRQNASDVLGTVKAYACQELLDPLAGMPRWLALGCSAASS